MHAAIYVTRRAAALTRNHRDSAGVIRNTDAVVQTTDQQVQQLTANRDSAAVELEDVMRLNLEAASFVDEVGS